MVASSEHAVPPVDAGLKLHILDMALPHGKGFIGTVTGGPHVAESKFLSPWLGDRVVDGPLHRLK